MSYVSLYRRALDELGKPALPIGVHSPGYVADTDARAREEFWPDYKRMRDRIGGERGWGPMSRAEFADFVKADYARWEGIVKNAGVEKQ
jgi:hypothetical protein